MYPVVVSRTSGTATLVYTDLEREDQEDSATTRFAAQSANYTRKFAVNAELWRTEFHAIAVSLREMLAMAAH